MSTSYQEFIAKLKEISPAIAKAFLEAVADVASATQLRALEAAIKRGDVQGALSAINLGREFWAPLDRAIGQAFETGAVWQLAQTIPGRLAGRLQIRFDGRHSRAESWNRSHGSRLITEVADSVKEAVRVVIEDGLAAGRNPRKVALEIAGRVDRASNRRTGGVIGLTGRQAGYVVNARRQLEELDRGYFERALRDRRFDRMVTKAIREGKPLAQADIDRIVGRYSDRLLFHRGETIARTEGLTALNAGRHEGIQQLAEKAGLPQSAIMVEWISTPDSRTRDSHRDMNRQKVREGEPFVTPDGHRMLFPGDTSMGAPASETINCRCSFRTVVDWQAVADQAA